MGTCLALQQLPFHYRSLLDVTGRRSFSSPSPTAAGSGLKPLTCARGTLEMSSVPHVEETQGTRSPGLPLMHVDEVQPVLSEGTSFMSVGTPCRGVLGVGVVSLRCCSTRGFTHVRAGALLQCCFVSCLSGLAAGSCSCPMLLGKGQTLCRALGACPAQ